MQLLLLTFNVLVCTLYVRIQKICMLCSYAKHNDYKFWSHFSISAFETTKAMIGSLFNFRNALQSIPIHIICLKSVRVFEFLVATGYVISHHNPKFNTKFAGCWHFLFQPFLLLSSSRWKTKFIFELPFIYFFIGKGLPIVNDPVIRLDIAAYRRRAKIDLCSQNPNSAIFQTKAES